MRKQIEKIILKIFPELTAGLHLDRFARVLAINDAPADGAASERYRPRYAVDIEVLTADGEVDEAYPVYEAVPLPVPMGCGHESGVFAFPEPGALVVVSFAYGRPDIPLIRQIYPQGFNLPPVKDGEQRWQQSPGVAQVADRDGNWSRTTNGNITDACLRRVAQAVENLDDFARELRTIHENSIEEVGGSKVIEAMGAFRFRSGASANLVAVDNINLVTARDVTMTAAQDRHEVTGRHHVGMIKGNMEETVQGNRTEDVGGNRTESTGGDITSDIGGDLTATVGGSSTEQVTDSKVITADFINLQATSIRMGQAGGISLLPTIISFMEEVRCALQDLADHTHSTLGAACDQQGELAQHSTDVGTLKGNMTTLSG
jgi:hypothetical protein